MSKPIRATIAAATAAALLLGELAPAWSQEQPYQPPDPQAYPQQPPPGYQQQPPPGYPQQPPPGYQQPPPGYPQGYQQPPPGYPPPGYPVYVPRPRTLVRYELRPRYGLIAGGASMLGAAWAITAISGLITAAASDICNASTSTAGCPNAAWPLFIPVVGPFIEVAYITGAGTSTARGLLIFDGIVQSAGLAMLIAGAVTRKRVPIYANAHHLQLSPYSLSSGAGLVLSGQF